MKQICIKNRNSNVVHVSSSQMQLQCTFLLILFQSSLLYKFFQGTDLLIGYSTFKTNDRLSGFTSGSRGRRISEWACTEKVHIMLSYKQTQSCLHTNTMVGDFARAMGKGQLARVRQLRQGQDFLGRWKQRTSPILSLFERE